MLNGAASPHNDAVLKIRSLCMKKKKIKVKRMRNYNDRC